MLPKTGRYLGLTLIAPDGEAPILESVKYPFIAITLILTRGGSTC